MTGTMRRRVPSGTSAGVPALRGPRGAAGRLRALRRPQERGRGRCVRGGGSARAGAAHSPRPGNFFSPLEPSLPRTPNFCSIPALGGRVMPNGRVFQDFSAVPWGLFSWSRDSLSCAFRIQKAVPRVNKNPEVTASNPPRPPHTQPRDSGLQDLRSGLLLGWVPGSKARGAESMGPPGRNH